MPLSSKSFTTQLEPRFCVQHASCWCGGCHWSQCTQLDATTVLCATTCQGAGKTKSIEKHLRCHETLVSSLGIRIKVYCPYITAGNIVLRSKIYTNITPENYAICQKGISSSNHWKFQGLWMANMSKKNTLKHVFTMSAKSTIHPGEHFYSPVFFLPKKNKLLCKRSASFGG